MTQFRSIDLDLVDAVITFDEFVEYGRQNGANIVNGMPWSFEYKGYRVSHENDEAYIITSPSVTKKVGYVETDGSQRSFGNVLFRRGDELHVTLQSELVVVSRK